MYSLKSKFTYFLLSISLFGCATPPQSRVPNPTGPCLAGIMRSPELTLISNKIIFGTRASLDMQADKSRPTPEELPAIQAADARYAACIDLGNEWRTQYMPIDAQTVGNRFVRDTQASLAILYRGEITYGQYNAHYNSLRADLEQRMGELGAIHQQQQDEFRKKEAIARIMAPPLPPLPTISFPAIQPLPRAVSTTCQRFGNQVTCNTQ